MLGDKSYILLRDSEDWDYIFGVVIVQTTTEAQIQEAIREFKETQWVKQDLRDNGWVLTYDNGDHNVYWTENDDYTEDIDDPLVMIYSSEEEALSDITFVKKEYEKLTDYPDALFRPELLSKIKNDPMNEDYNLDCLLEFLGDKFVDLEFVSIDDAVTF